MGVTVELPEDVVRRLTAEAERRGVSIDVIIAELAAQLPGEDALEAFIGCGASGRSEPFDIHAERTNLAAKRFAEGTEPLCSWSTPGSSSHLLIETNACTNRVPLCCA